MHSPYPSELNNDSHRALVFFVENTVDYMLEQSAAAHRTFRHVQNALTVSFTHPALLLAIASSALSHRAMTTAVHPGSLTRPTEPRQRSHALQYFGKAIEQMQRDMRHARNEDEIGPILLGCMFFFVFEASSVYYARSPSSDYNANLCTTCTDQIKSDRSLC